MFFSRKGKHSFLVFAAITCVFLSFSAIAQESETEEILKQLSEIRQELKQVKEELRVIKANIKKPVPVAARRLYPKAAAKKELSIAGAPVIGDDEAQIAVIEFSDYQCPFCRRHFKRTLPELQKNYIDTGKIKYVMKQYPLGFHAKARDASIAVLCSEQQKKGTYWKIHHSIFNGDTILSRESYLATAKTLALDETQYIACLDDPKMSDKVDADMADGTSVGVSGTPAFLIGKLKDGKVVNAQLMSGAHPYASFSRVIDGLLK